MMITDPWAHSYRPAHPSAVRSAWLGWLWRAAGTAALAGAAPGALLAANERPRDALVAAATTAALACLVAAVRTRTAWVSWGLLLAVGVGAGAVPSGANRVGVASALTLALASAATGLAPIPGDRRRVAAGRPPVAWLAIAPMIAAQAAILRGRGTTLLVPGRATFVLLAASGALVAATARAPAPVAWFERRLFAVLQVVATSLAGLVLLVIALPVLYLPGAVARVVSRVAHPGRPARDGRPGWIVRSDGLGDVVRDASRPFATTPAADRRRRTAFAAAAATMAVVVLVSLVARRPPAASGPLSSPVVLKTDESPKYSQLPPYLGLAWADELQVEEELPNPPGRFVTIVDGVRRTLPPPACTCVPLRVWMFGGSAGWGVGQRDGGTIASALTRDAAQVGFSLEVLNMSEKGATVIQEYEKFAARLERGDPPPDLALFYDGFNDVVAFTMRAALRGLEDTSPVILKPADFIAYRDRGYPSLAPLGGPDTVGRLATSAYEEVQAKILASAEEYGVDTAFVRQADALSTPRRLRDMNLDAASADQWASGEMARTMAVAAEHRPAGTIDLRLALDDAPHPVFLSPVHHNELGSEIVAEKLLPLLLPTLHRLAATNPLGTTPG